MGGLLLFYQHYSGFMFAEDTVASSSNMFTRGYQHPTLAYFELEITGLSPLNHWTLAENWWIPKEMIREKI